MLSDDDYGMSSLPNSLGQQSFDVFHLSQEFTLGQKLLTVVLPKELDRFRFTFPLITDLAYRYQVVLLVCPSFRHWHQMIKNEGLLRKYNRTIDAGLPIPGQY